MDRAGLIVLLRQRALMGRASRRRVDCSIIAAAQEEIDEGGRGACAGRKGRTADDNPRAGWQGSGSDSSRRRDGDRRHDKYLSV